MIKAIPTTYNAITFRSRLEARYAVFFDHLGVKWGYETEGFDFGGQRYLPDFELFNVKNDWQQRIFFEVKPLPLQIDYVLMLEAFVRAGDFILIYGDADLLELRDREYAFTSIQKGWRGNVVQTPANIYRCDKCRYVHLHAVCPNCFGISPKPIAPFNAALTKKFEYE